LSVIALARSVAISAQAFCNHALVALPELPPELVKFSSCSAMLLEIAILVLAVAVAALTWLLFAEQIAKKLKHIPKGTLDGDSPVEISETTVFICMTSKGVYHDRGCFHLKDHLKNAKKYDVCSECEKFPGTAIFISKKDTLHYHHTDGHIKDYLKGAKKYELCVDCNNLRQLRNMPSSGTSNGPRARRAAKLRDEQWTASEKAKKEKQEDAKGSEGDQ